jgi:histone-lysine N-methyltransferase SETMAR
MGLSLQHLLWHADGGDTHMLNRIVTGDQLWVHHYQPKSRCASMQWKHPSSPSTKMFKVTPSAGKVMLTFLGDSHGVLLASFHKHGENVNSDSYCEVLSKLWAAIHRKGPGQLVRRVLLQHNNARPHTARATQERIQELQWELPEHPPYSPDLAPSDFHLFGLLKTTLVANVSPMTKRLRHRCGSDQAKSQKTSMLRVSTHW